MERFGRSKQPWLKKFLRLKNGIPSHDTFRRIFSLIDTDQLQRATITFLSEAIDEKTNEIPVAQKALKSMDLKGCIVTFDALHTQKDTLAVIRGQKEDYLGGLA